MKKIMEGSRAVAEAVRLCQPQVVAAYPITPQTHIIEYLAQMVADGDLTAEYISAESEFAAASVVLGAVAAGARSFTASASQGLLLMTEVLYNIAGLRLPVVMVCANRAIGAPINIFSDHQDSMTVRDAGWIQLYVASNQEAVDTIIQAYRIAETCELPVMVCMDGFLLTHTFEPVEIPTADIVATFLPVFQFARSLDPRRPMTLGGGSEPDNYQEYRAEQHAAMVDALQTIEDVAQTYHDCFSNSAISGTAALLEPYRIEGAATVFVSMGALTGTVQDAVDSLREQDQNVGALRIRCFRPFPAAALAKLLSAAQHVIVLDKALSVGAGGIVASELRTCLYQAGMHRRVDSFICGLGGRDVTSVAIENIYSKAMAEDRAVDCQFFAHTATTEKYNAVPQQSKGDS